MGAYFLGRMLFVGLPAALLAASLNCPVALPHGCSLPGAIVSLNASWAACFSLTTQRASSLRECVEWCRAIDMTPACIGSAEENAFAAALVSDDDGVWIGHYQQQFGHVDSSSDPAEGWERCVAGEASGFANWDEELGQPSGQSWGLHSACAGIAGNGGWYDSPCVVPAMIGLTFRCLCEGPSSPTDSFAADQAVLDARLEADVRKHEASTVLLGTYCGIVALLPALLFGIHQLWRGRGTIGAPKVRTVEGKSEHGGEEFATAGAQRLLENANHSAAQRRRRVSGLMLQIGWLLFVFGIVPPSLRDLEVAFGWNLWIPGLWPLGPYLMLIAVLPTDARPVRILMHISFFVTAGYGVSNLRRVTQLPESGVHHVANYAHNFAHMTLLFGTAARLVKTIWVGRYAMPPRRALKRIWHLLRLYSVGTAVVHIAWAGAVISTYPHFVRYSAAATGRLVVAAVWIACSAVARPTNRGRFQGFLGRLGVHREGTGEEKAAAISALIGGAIPAEVLAEAKGLFRCLLMSDLTKEDMDGSGLKGPSASPDKAKVDPKTLAAKTQQAKLGEVTAFVSHSWNDEKEPNIGKKYEAIRTWAQQRRVDDNGKEPTLWLVRSPQHHPQRQASALL